MKYLLHKTLINPNPKNISKIFSIYKHWCINFGRFSYSSGFYNSTNTKWVVFSFAPNYMYLKSMSVIFGHFFYAYTKFIIDAHHYIINPNEK